MIENPLLDFNDLPQFDRIKSEHISPAIEELIFKANAAVDKVIHSDKPASWDSIVAPLTDASEQLSRAWGIVSHLNSVVSNSSLRNAFNENLAKVSLHYAEVGQNLELFKRFKELENSAEYDKLSTECKKALSNDLRDFHLSGAELPEESKQRFTDIQTKLADLSAKFEQNVLDATDSFAIYIDDLNKLIGLPEDILEMFAAAAKQDGKTGYKITLQMPFYLPIMQYCEDRELRETLYKSYVTRASEFGEPTLDNSQIIHERLPLLREEAQLLGYKNYAELSLVSKMAESPQQVIEFLRNLSKRARSFAIRDHYELTQFASKLGLAEIQAWDVSFISEKLRQERYDFSDQEVKQYFPEHKVLHGLFGLLDKLYNIQIRQKSAPVWHPDVLYFQLLENGNVIGGFYFDLYAREGKRGGAWMDDARGRRRIKNKIQIPVAYLTCNFSHPVGDKPALFTHDEVITLFHEFGHGLHHLLTQVDELAVSGINGVEWDAVELPSQFMENFCWEWDVIRDMSCHVDNGEQLPRELFDKMLSAKNFQSGLSTLRQIEFSLFDMLLHENFDPTGDYQALLKDVRNELSVLFPPDYNRFANSFSHIFAGGYSAGYYSYKWAELLSSDVYAAFEEAGGANCVTGKRFRDEILAVGGSRTALESFRAFRLRDPQIDAMLKHSGMAENLPIE